MKQRQLIQDIISSEVQSVIYHTEETGIVLNLRGQRTIMACVDNNTDMFKVLLLKGRERQANLLGREGFTAKIIRAVSDRVQRHDDKQLKGLLYD